MRGPIPLPRPHSHSTSSSVLPASRACPGEDGGRNSSFLPTCHSERSAAERSGVEESRRRSRPLLPHPPSLPSRRGGSRTAHPLHQPLVGATLGACFRSSNQVIELVRSQRHKAETAYLLVVYRSICGYSYACRHALLPRTEARGLLKQAPCGRPLPPRPHSLFHILLRFARVESLPR